MVLQGLLRAAKEMSATTGGRARLKPCRQSVIENGFSPGEPWLKPLLITSDSPGLKPGASTADEGITFNKVGTFVRLFTTTEVVP